MNILYIKEKNYTCIQLREGITIFMCTLNNNNIQKEMQN